ncbi:MAG: HAD family phosphatase [Betaproteobacteria bacterium]
MPAAAITAVLFDFGGVLAELRGEAHLLPLVSHRLSRDEMWAYWSRSPAVRAHETGRISAETFAEQIVAEMELSVPPQEFLSGFREWVVGPFAGTHDLVRDVAARHTTALVSNTSAVHWPVIESMGVLPHMHHVFASYQIGHIKPDRAFFDFVIAQMAIAPQEAVFFDDSPLNVAAARAAGLHAYRVDGAAAVRQHLVTLGMLPI